MTRTTTRPTLGTQKKKNIPALWQGWSTQRPGLHERNSPSRRLFFFLWCKVYLALNYMQKMWCACDKCGVYAINVVYMQNMWGIHAINAVCMQHMWCIHAIYVMCMQYMWCTCNICGAHAIYVVHTRRTIEAIKQPKGHSQRPVVHSLTSTHPSPVLPSHPGLSVVFLCVQTL